MLDDSTKPAKQIADRPQASLSAPSRKAVPYIFLGQTTSLCETCHALVPAKIMRQGDDVYYQKRCKEHGVQKTLISSDAQYYLLARDYLKPGDMPQMRQTKVDYGCPFDCGLCPDHEQHSCLAIIEVNEQCDLTCPVCFAGSSPQHKLNRSLEEISRMFDTLVESEGEPDLVQISGGEPTLHPQILKILEMAMARPIRHVMINTNGLRIAKDEAFVEQLAKLKPGFEVYLQFDSLNNQALKNLRGADLTRIRRQALENLEKHNISTTLVVTMKKGVNDTEVGDIIRHALKWKCVRGVTFQPIQDAGRNDDFEAKSNRLLLSDIRRSIIDADVGFGSGDMIPLPCNPESISIGYALRNEENIVAITSFIPKDIIVSEIPNAVTFEKYPELRERMFEFFSLSTTPKVSEERLESLLCCLPEIETPKEISYENLFRIAISEFLDAHNFCIARVKRSCVHFITADNQIIPFDTYNLFYRDGKIEERRAAIGK